MTRLTPMIPRFSGLLAFQLALTLPGGAADDPAFAGLDSRMADEIRPLLSRYCHGCHNADKQKGDLNLERFDTVAAARRDTAVWEKTLDQVALGEMPPDDEPQPTADEKNRLMTWVREFLEAEGRASAGDPGRVVMRRLNNTEYTLTVRDLTGVPLDPAREFPVDGAAGEGFVNVGEALAMSPALFDKYLAAAKEIATHTVLLPNGFRFSTSDRRGDWAEEVMARIRALYARHTDAAGATPINLQGIQFDTNAGGRLPVEKYLTATTAAREAMIAGTSTPEDAARAHGLNPKYFGILWSALNQPDASSLVSAVAQRWRSRPPEETVAFVNRWQGVLTRFQTVGHVKPWMVPVDPLQSRQEVRVKLPEQANGDVVRLFLATSDAGDGTQNDATHWQQPRLVMPGRPDVLLRDVRARAGVLAEQRAKLFADTSACLAAAAEAETGSTPVSVEALAAAHGVPPAHLAAWLQCLGIGGPEPLSLDYFTDRLAPDPAHPFVAGWGRAETPNLIANPSDQHVRVPGNLRGGGVAVHPSPTLNAAVGWRSPVSALFRITVSVMHAHPECGNGVTWALELRRGLTRRRLATGIAHGGAPASIPPIESLTLREGDLISLLIGPRDGNHSCDLTDVDLVLEEIGGEARAWSLTHDIAADVLAGNPHADSSGRPDIWHFYTEPVATAEAAIVLPHGSTLARWQAAPNDEDRKALAAATQDLLTGATTPAPDSPDAALKRLLSSLRGPLLSALPNTPETTPAVTASDWGLDPSAFDPSGNLRTLGLSLIEIRLPASLVGGCEFVATATTADPGTSIQVAATLEPPVLAAGELDPGRPILVADEGSPRQRFLTAFADFRSLFPAALCYPKIIPVDEVITLTVYHREDDHLVRLMLDEAEKSELDQLWNDLRFIGQDALTMVDAYEQLLEYASQDSDPKLFYHLKDPIYQRAAAFRQTLTESEPRHLEQLVDFIALAYRRPTTQAERDDVRRLYHTLREQDLAHDEAFRLTLARTLVSPAFLYRAEQPAEGEDPQPVSDWELANRLSYFLWSSMPDETLRARARDGSLSRPDVLRAEARRLLAHPRVRALATEFACQWLHIREFDQLDEKSERHFPEFAALRADMYEESIRFFTDLFQNDGFVMGIVDADHTFLNESLAAHYRIPGVTGPEWRRVEGIKAHGRGGVLGMATMLAKHSGASRTSPILRGNWLVEVLLGDKLPKPPAGVPPLPETEDQGDLTMRQITERHSADPNCFGCHARIDAYGYALEPFDAIGRLRSLDLGGRPIDATVTLPSGLVIEGPAGLRHHVAVDRQEEFLKSFCRKLLGYALGRGLKLSDQPLVARMVESLRQNDFRFTTALDLVLESPQFLRQRGLEATREEEIR